MMNKIIESFTLNGKIVVKTQHFLGFEIFEDAEDNSDSKCVYFVAKEKDQRVVKGQISVAADCSQNSGFIDHFSMTEIK